MTSTLERIEHDYNPYQQPLDRAVIWLHGLGASGHDFEPIVPSLGLDKEGGISQAHGIRFIFPHAPTIPVTVAGGYVMPAWYDILERSLERKIDIAQIHASAAKIAALIEEQISVGIDSRHIVLAGFSQGGAVAYQTALSFTKPLGGLLALSTYLASKENLKLADANQQLPIAIHHGKLDGVVPELLGQQARDWLTAHGYQPEYHTYHMAHQVCPSQIKDIGQWLNRVLV